MWYRHCFSYCMINRSLFPTSSLPLIHTSSVRVCLLRVKTVFHYLLCSLMYPWDARKWDVREILSGCFLEPLLKWSWSPLFDHLLSSLLPSWFLELCNGGALATILDHKNVGRTLRLAEFKGAWPCVFYGAELHTIPESSTSWFWCGVKYTFIFLKPHIFRCLLMVVQPNPKDISNFQKKY